MITKNRQNRDASTVLWNKILKWGCWRLKEREARLTESVRLGYYWLDRVTADVMMLCVWDVNVRTQGDTARGRWRRSTTDDRSIVCNHSVTAVRWLLYCCRCFCCCFKFQAVTKYRPQHDILKVLCVAKIRMQNLVCNEYKISVTPLPNIRV